MQQLGELAQDLLEERVRDGSASPTESVALLRINSPTEVANLERIQAQTAYLHAQRAKAESETVRQDMLEKAMEAMRRYNPNE